MVFRWAVEMQGGGASEEDPGPSSGGSDIGSGSGGQETGSGGGIATTGSGGSAGSAMTSTGAGGSQMQGGGGTSAGGTGAGGRAGGNGSGGAGGERRSGRERWGGRWTGSCGRCVRRAGRGQSFREHHAAAGEPHRQWHHAGSRRSGSLRNALRGHRQEGPLQVHELRQGLGQGQHRAEC